MRHVTKEELQIILEKHKKWLADEDCGERADLSGADLSGANLSYANLYGADLSGADLSGANLYCADLYGADLYGADLSGANLYGADLYGADLSGANLYCADLSGADLYGADLSYANLYGADLYGADLSGANLYGADLYGADLSAETKIEQSALEEYFPICCPSDGAFIGWKKASGKIVKLLIPEDAKRSSAFGRKCRCSKAVVLGIEECDGTDSELTEVCSNHDRNFIYVVNQTVSVGDFCEDRKRECAPGIHFFITRQEAVDYR